MNKHKFQETIQFPLYDMTNKVRKPKFSLSDHIDHYIFTVINAITYQKLTSLD
jgi:hypothetical protein